MGIESGCLYVYVLWSGVGYAMGVYMFMYCGVASGTDSGNGGMLHIMYSSM